MSKKYMTMKEKAAAIRKELKEQLGVTNRQVSVRSRNSGYDEAIDIYKSALKQDPFLDKALYNMAVIYEKIGLNKEAVKTWNNYIKIAQDEEKIAQAERFIKELNEYTAMKKKR